MELQLFGYQLPDQERAPDAEYDLDGPVSSWQAWLCTQVHALDRPTV